MSTYLYGGDYGVETEIHGVLNLSYEKLPYYLKSCFLDMGRYEEDEVIYAEELCLMWIAHGMISHPKEENLMDIAQGYLSELASRCVVEIVEDDLIRGQVGRMCKLHDVVRELCLSIGKEEDFGLQILGYEGGTFSHSLQHDLSSAKTRHLVVNFDIIHAISTSWKDLRSGKLTIAQGCHLSSDFKKLFTFPNLHGLAIINVRIGKLLKELESQVYGSNLVSLSLGGCEIEEDPMATLGKLPLLRHLRMAEGCFVGEEMTCHESSFLVCIGLE